MQPEVSEMQGRQTSDKANDEQSAIQGHGDKHEEAKKDTILEAYSAGLG